MNLTKLFNKNYFIQNLKKSKTLFGITIAIVPILTVLVLINLHIENTTILFLLQFHKYCLDIYLKEKV